MYKLLFDSGPLNFSSDPSIPILVHHNLKHPPPIIQFYGESETVVGFPKIEGSSGPYLEDTFDYNTIKVYKPSTYPYTGKFRLKIYIG